MKTVKFQAKGTTCESCAEIIKKQAMKINGVKEIKFDYNTESGEVTFNDQKTTIEDIFKKIEEKGYTCSLVSEKSNVFGWIFGLIGVLVVAYFLWGFVDTIQLPQISQNMGYGLLFLAGLLTGFHCIAMCGGFVVSYTAKHAQEGTKSYKSHFMYGFGKVVSYTVIGAAFGLLGSIIIFTPLMKGVAGLLAGLFLVIFGINMLGLIPWLRNIRIRMPNFLNKFIGKESSKHKSPLVIGLLNGLMIACGPLQAIYIMAAGTGSAIEGAKLLFIFGLGTLPVMLGFGFFTSFISSKMTHKILKASGVIVIILGLIMINRGLVLTGTGFDFSSLTTNNQNQVITGNNVAVESDGSQIINMDVTRNGWEPETFVLKKGVPVKWVINGKELNSCNNAIQVPKLGLYFDIKPGEQTINFVPKDEGVIPFSCSMGMITGQFIVKEDISNIGNIEQEVYKSSNQGSTCSMGSGCGCGM